MLRVLFASVLLAGFGAYASAAESEAGRPAITKLAAKQSITKQSVEDRFKEMDADGDGKVSLDEYKAYVKKHLKDQNKYEQAMTRAEKRFKQIDTNGDGFISLEELKAAPPPKKKKNQDT